MSAKALLEHGYYGCDSGCCGMTLAMPDGEDRWTFSHPPDDATDDEVLTWAAEEFEVAADEIELGEWRC